MSLPLSAEEDAGVGSYRASLARELRLRLGPPRRPVRQPLVSIVVITQDGRELLKRMISGLADATDYPNLEVIVVDNQSSDGTAAYLAGLQTAFPLAVVAGEADLSFAAANARGAAQAAGDLLLFLNNDVEAFEPAWLDELVAALESSAAGAVGATLIHSEPLGAPAEAEPVAQHRTIALHWREGTVRPYNLGDGESLWEGSFGAERRGPAVTGACLLMARERFEQVGGFETGYRFGFEDLDLGLKLIRGGFVCRGVGRSVLIHRESSTQSRQDRDLRRVNRLANRRLLLERWGPGLSRAYRSDRLLRTGFWTGGEGPHLGITITDADPGAGWGDWYTAHEVGDALEALGWQITYLQRRGDEWYSPPQDIDYVLSLMDPFDVSRLPDHVITIAWIRNWTERWLARPWFGRIDLLLVSSGRSERLIHEATGRPSLRFPLATNPARFSVTTADPSRRSFDYVYTGNRWGERRAVETALDPRHGERLAVYGRGWDHRGPLRPHARGPAAYEELPGLYASTKLVLDDTQSPTLPYAAVNARVFDALAAGALPLTDCAAGVHELFDEEFPTWDSRDTLRAQIDELTHDEDRRRALVRRYRSRVLRDHTYQRRAAQLRDALVNQERRASFAIKICAPDRERARFWGDLHFAEALARELQRLGHRSLVQTIDEWEQEEGLRRDVVVHLRGLSRYRPKPGQVNVLWSISHPDALSAEECEGFDLVCTASSAFAAQLRREISKPVMELEQATDPRVFYPDPRPELAHDLVYVANSRGVRRRIIDDLLPTHHDLAVWGSGWDGVLDDGVLMGEHIPNAELRHVYSSAGIVLCDHWPDMAEHCYVSNRVYDALACGALVVSDDVAGLSERFGGGVVTYRTREELQMIIERFLADPEERRRRAAAGRAQVLHHHTFAATVVRLLSELEADGLGPREFKVVGG